ncbi:hypothetical protein [Oryza sativa Japonica Group]|jgi:hypothetical protein|uniref:Uncharacterized protein n=1 Tax=Oryza sativa subsp. japonica TaxID=39947 RepID=Q1EHU0_ORYSJ|nr:hypothetical protein [Oryza sativa Japonica Group]
MRRCLASSPIFCKRFLNGRKQQPSEVSRSHRTHVVVPISCTRRAARRPYLIRFSIFLFPMAVGGRGGGRLRPVQMQMQQRLRRRGPAAVSCPPVDGDPTKTPASRRFDSIRSPSAVISIPSARHQLAPWIFLRNAVLLACYIPNIHGLYFRCCYIP